MKIKIPSAFKKLKEPARYKVFFGGRGGAKSRSFATQLLLYALSGQERILCAREIQLSIKDSVKKILDDEIERLDVKSSFHSTKTSLQCLETGTDFIFTGLRDNIDKVKSTEGITKAWIEEAHTISQNSLDTLIPTIREPNSEIWMSFNPKFKTDPVYKMFLEDTPPPNSIIQKVNFYNNPFFPNVLKQEMEWCRSKDPDKYQHVWEGHPVVHSEEQVFNGHWVIEEFADPPDDQPIYFGGDFGFSVDPNTLVRFWIKDRDMFIDYESYKVGVEIDMIPAEYDKVKGSRKWTIIADSARPDTISYLKRQGFKIKGASKGAGSIEDGIQFLKGFNIKIHPRCKNTIDEFMTYKYKKDKHTNEILPIILDKNNHIIDALRYGSEPLRKVSVIYIS